MGFSVEKSRLKMDKWMSRARSVAFTIDLRAIVEPACIEANFLQRSAGLESRG
jgi:hypothetical protein